MTLTLPEVLNVVRTAGIRLEARGDRLHVEAPPGAVTPAVRDALTAHKPQLLVLLAPPKSFVTLKGGLTVPTDALALALNLEARGVTLRTDQDHQFVIPNDPRLSEPDHAAIQRWRHHLGAIVEYRVPEVA